VTEQNRKWAKLSPEKREAIKATREKKLVEASVRLSSGVKALLKENRWKEYLNFSLKFHQYSFANTMLIMLQRPDATWVASFNTWKSMGRYVKKDEHGIEIFVPMLPNIATRERNRLPKMQSLILMPPSLSLSKMIPKKTREKHSLDSISDMSSTCPRQMETTFPNARIGVWKAMMPACSSY